MYTFSDPWSNMDSTKMELMVAYLLQDLKNRNQLTPQFKAKIEKDLMRYKLKEAMTKQFAIFRM